MKKEITFTAKQVGERVKERRTELNLTMPELGKRVGVNKSTIQRYEADGVDPKRTMIINGLAASTAFSRVLTLMQVPQAVSSFILEHFNSPVMILLVINLYIRFYLRSW